jgi:hypothetical protein
LKIRAKELNGQDGNGKAKRKEETDGEGGR